MDPGVPAQAGVPHPGAPAGAGPDLAALLQRSARGDRAAFAALYDATAARVHGLALRVVRDPAQAEEVTQEAFLGDLAHGQPVRRPTAGARCRGC